MPFNLTLENIASLFQNASDDRSLAANPDWQERCKRELTDLVAISERSKLLPDVPPELAELGAMLRKLRKEVRRAERAGLGGDFRGAATHVQSLVQAGKAINQVAEDWRERL